MKLHYGKLSSSSRRVTIAARLLGLKLDEHHVDLRDAADRTALARLNPNNKVPVLVDGDLVLWESVRLPSRPYANVQAWFERMQKLPEWQATEPPPIQVPA